MKRALPFLFLLLLATAPALPAQSARQAAAAAADETEIRTVINAQSEAWNRADIPTFMQAYEDSPDTTFIGLTLRKGFKPIRERYMLNYTTPEQMGKLSFNDLEVRLLPNSCGKTEYAVVTGKFHLERTAHGEAKKDDGIFSLVWRKGPHGWKIIVDHTS
ncbi:MAG TPA: nuclear transport factor 2 family protein [Terracidiphilus sp.]|nr:nuclear transport factor 2 family protein [Terracidiphilus sp.]